MMNPHESIEVLMRSQGWQGYILGCDEVGRGPLAGPATVACVAFPRHLDAEFELFSRLDDSKKLSAKKRESLVEEIQNAAAAYAVIDITPQEIDERNILQACLWGMGRAVEDVVKKLGDATTGNTHVIVDGNKLIPHLAWPQTAYIKGDGRSWSIAAASILAKVHRDNLMIAYDSEYPGYGFAQNVGYPTAAHRKALIELGPTPIHRKSFKCK
ncbi:MAG: ribonuclease HII [Proteobacteria bacterium]|nr:ribonuclease HII [Pseudomonadota bacterium]